MYNPQTGMFDATQTPPEQGGSSHPNGKFPAYISNTERKPNKEQTGHYLEVEFTTPAGKISSRYNFWNNSAQAVEIAGKQFSALCYATGRFHTNINNAAPELRGAQLQIEVAPQRGNNQYNEVAKVFTQDGQEPGAKGVAGNTNPATNGGFNAPGGTQQHGNFQQQPPASGFGQQPNQPQQPPANAGWNTPGQQQPPQGQQGGFQPGPNMNPQQPAGFTPGQPQQGFQPQQQGQPVNPNAPAAAPGWSQGPGGNAPPANWGGPR